MGHDVAEKLLDLINHTTISKLEKGYADMQAGRTKNAKKAFADIRKDYGL